MIDIKTPYLIVIGAVVILLVIALLWVAASFYYRESLFLRRQKRRQISALKKHQLAISGHRFLSFREKKQIKAMVKTGDLASTEFSHLAQPAQRKQFNKTDPAPNASSQLSPLSDLDCRSELEATIQVILEASELLSQSSLQTEQTKLVSDIVDQAQHARTILDQCAPVR